MRWPALIVAASPAPARHGIRPAAERVLQLDHPEPGRPPDRLHADDLRHPSDGTASRSRSPSGGRAAVPLHLRQRGCRGGAVGEHLHKEHAPRPPLPEPAGDLPRPQAEEGGEAVPEGLPRPRPRRRRAGRGARPPRVHDRRLPRGREGHRGRDDQDLVGRGVPAPPSGDSIALRRAGTGVDRFVEPRFGAGYQAAHGRQGRVRRRPGRGRVGQQRDRRRHQLVARPFLRFEHLRRPVGGSAPTDASVRALSHPNAYPISFVMLKRLKDVSRSPPRS